MLRQVTDRNDGYRESQPAEKSTFGAPRRPDLDEALNDRLRSIRESERTAERVTAGITIG